MILRAQCFAFLGLVFALTGCEKRSEAPPEIRSVRAITVTHAVAGEPASLTGAVQAQNTVNLAFRIGGRLLERRVGLGDLVAPGQVISRLDPQDSQNALRTAQANLSAAQGVLALAKVSLQRQANLMTQGATARAQYDQADQQLKSAQAGVDSSLAQFRSAQNNLGYNELISDISGAVVAKGAEPGEVVQAGQMIVQVAKAGGRDAVFNVPGQMIRQSPKDPPVTVTLSDESSISAQGRVREVSPKADPVTGTYVVKIGLINPRPAMRLGATVTGSIMLEFRPGIDVPASALTEIGGKPAVWIFDRANKTVNLRQIAVARFDPDSVMVARGLRDGDIVVTAGVQALHPGQKVRLLSEAAGARP